MCASSSDITKSGFGGHIVKHGFMTLYETSKCPVNHGRRYLASKIQDGSQLNGSSDISETMKGTVKIPTTNLWFTTMYSWKIVLVSKYNSDRQPEISIWPQKPEIITSLEL